MQYKVDFDAIPWQNPAPTIRDKSCQQSGTKLRLVEYSREMEPHWCTKGHVGYVLDGSMEISVGGQVLLLEAGDGVFLPSGEEHKHMAKILTDVVKVIFVEEA